MLREKWNNGWTLQNSDGNFFAAMMGGAAAAEPVALPHDAMIHEVRGQDNKNGHQTGFYPGGCYTYSKTFHAPEDWAGKTVLIEFEGIYQNARVMINGDYAGGHPYGYTEFAVCADDFLKYGEDNTVTVITNNSAEGNSRWYSGSGIYRNVNLLVGNRLHIARNSLRITTPEIDPELAVVQIDMELVNLGREKVRTEVFVELTGKAGPAGATRVPVTLFGNHTERIRARIEVKNPVLWNCEEPNLYDCQARLTVGGERLDEVKERFGIRSLSLSASRGLRINGEEVKLRGACIHHDNGVIGAATFERAEERRIELLKAAGFNAIRSSHHPASRALIEACDRVGVLVMDELADSWTRTKNNNDYAEKFPYFWREDVAAMVVKDFNHPSVILYSTGNEIQEAGTPKGAQLNREITNEFHRLDGGRYVTVGANGLLAGGARMGEIMCDITGMTPEQMAQNAQKAQKQEGETGGADAVNGAMDIMQGPMADAFAANHILTEILEEFVSANDILGYNYLTGRHVLEHELDPNHTVLGTETFPSDIVRLWDVVKNNHHVIGDMTWTGWDYIGEAGCGVTYYDGRQGFMSNWPISLSGMGDMDILGNRRPISFVREIVFGLRKEPFIAVEPVDHYGETPSQTTWPWKDERISWTWAGFEGKPAVVNVYSDGDEVELFLNGESLGRKPAGETNGFAARFETVYQPGELKAVCYRGGTAAEFDTLRTAGETVHLHVEADRQELQADGADLGYVMISLRDEDGVVNPQLQREVTVTVEGAGVLQGMGSADVETGNHYFNNTWETFGGYVLAVVRAGNEPGEITVTASGFGEQKEIRLKVN